MKGLTPDHNTISNFRRDNPKAIKKVFRATVQIAKNFELIGGKLIAGDSTKLRAQNSKKNNFNKKKIERHLVYIENKLEDYNKQLSENDKDINKDLQKENTEKIKSEIKKQNKRKENYKWLEKQLEETGEKQISTTDPESRQMITRNNITEVAYNVQTSVEGKETVFEMPVKGKKVAIEYDPDARLFAIIKDHKKTFTEGLCGFNFPEDTISYISEDVNNKLHLWFSKSRKGISIHKKTGNSESCLELTNELSPVRYIANGDTVFNQNINEKTINFKKKKFDIAEPVYPKEFIPFLFSIIDWNDVDELSLLYLIPDSKDCRAIFCKSKKKPNKGFELIMEYPLSDDKIKIVSTHGVPQSFTTLEGKKFSIEKI